MADLCPWADTGIAENKTAVLASTSDRVRSFAISKKSHATGSFFRLLGACLTHGEMKRMKETPNRDHLVGARVRESEKDRIILAAKLQGVTLSELVRMATLDTTTRILTGV